MGFALSSTERLGDFSSESVVSHLVSRVSSWVACFVFGWALVWLYCLGLVLEDTWLLLSPILQHVGIVNQRQYVFDDRLSLERARHELKKKD